MNLDARDLIIVNSTIISGILILLTISSFSPGEFPNRSIFVTLAVLSVIFFSISSLYVLSEDFDKAIKYIQIGFISVICFMIFIGVVNVINIIDPGFWEGPIKSKIAPNIILSKLGNNDHTYFTLFTHNNNK